MGDTSQGSGAESTTLPNQELCRVGQSGPFCDASYRLRLDKYRQLFEAHKVSFNNVAIQIVNLEQNAEHFFHGLSHVAPRLLKKSMLYDLVSNKEFVPVQHWLIQGYPVPGLVPQYLSDFFPFPSLVDHGPVSNNDHVVTDAETREVTGMAFHLSCVGAILMYAWAAADVAEGR